MKAALNLFLNFFNSGFRGVFLDAFNVIQTTLFCFVTFTNGNHLTVTSLEAKPIS